MKKAAAALAALIFCGLCPTSPAKAYNDEKIGYGQGVMTDSENRPVGALQAQEKYGEAGGIFIGEDEKVVYLTFDEGYENGYTDDILDVLKEKNVKATFYITYDYAKSCPDLVKRMANEGHEIGNHTYSHPSLPECTDEQITQEISMLEKYVYENFGYRTSTLRPPMGEFSERTLKIADSLGYKSVFWSFAYCDWDTANQPDAVEAVEKITESTHNGAIYLLHAVSKTNALILADVIDFWLSEGYEIKPVQPM